MLQLRELFWCHSLHLFEVLSEGRELLGRGRLVGRRTVAGARDAVVAMTVLRGAVGVGMRLRLLVLVLMLMAVFGRAMASARFPTVGMRM